MPLVFERLSDLDILRNFLSQCLGSDFTRSAIGNRDHHVPKRVLKALSLPVPSAYQLDALLYDIAKNYSVPWAPDPPRQFMYDYCWLS